MSNKKEVIEKVIEKTFYKDEELIQPDPVITISNKVILTASNYITISGLPKSRKTTFMQFFIASALTGTEYLGIKTNLLKNEKVVLIDTEQSIWDFYRQNKILKKLIGKNKLPKNFSAYLFREFDPDIILNSIYMIAETQKPKIIFIDNLTELAINPNDMAEAKKITQFLKMITSKFNLSIVCLLHLSKSNSFTLGNLGSYADRGAQAVLKVTLDKETDTSTLDCTMLRSDSHFLPVSIQYDQESKNYTQAETPEEEKTKYKKAKFSMNNFTDQEIKDRLEIVFEMQKTYNYNAFVQNLKKVFGVGDNAIKQIVIPYVTVKKYIKSINSEYHYYKN